MDERATGTNPTDKWVHAVAGGNVNRKGELIDVSQVEGSPLRRRVCLMARDKYPNDTVMVEPTPNDLTLYRLCTKTKEPKLPADFEWTIVAQGTLPELLEFVTNGIEQASSGEEGD